jgi:hypothetical protein
MRLKTVLLSLILLVGSTLYGIDNSLNTNNLLWSISMRETGGKCWSIGSSGERSQYQFLQSTWEQYSRVPFQRISDQNQQIEVERVARVYLRSITDRLTQEGLPVTVRNIALKWTGGLNCRYY